MKESQIRAKAKEQIIKDGGVPWFAGKIKFKAESDIWGVYDGLIVYPPNASITPIQLTTIANVRAREKKIKNFMREFNLSIFSQIWCWDKKRKEFRIFNIYDAKAKALEI